MNSSTAPLPRRRRWFTRWRNDLAMALTGDVLWVAARGDDEPVAWPAEVAVATADGRVVAVGEAARALRGQHPGWISVVRLADAAVLRDDRRLLTEAIRHLIAQHGGRGLCAPRVVFVAEASLRRDARAAVLEAGVGEVLLLEPPMAAAIGAGLAVESAEPASVLVLDRHACCFSVIARAGVVTGFSVAQGIDRLLDDVALRSVVTRAVAPDRDVLEATLRRDGLSGLAALAGNGRLGGSSSELLAGAATQPFQRWLAWNYGRALDVVAPPRRREIESSPLLLAGPYAAAPGLDEIVGTALGRRVTVAAQPEHSIILGARDVLSDLSFLLRHAGASPRAVVRQPKLVPALG